MEQQLQVYRPPQLVNKSLELNKVIRQRHEHIKIPLNGSNGYNSSENQIEFQVSTNDLIDPNSLAVSMNYTKPSGFSLIDGMNGLIRRVEVYVGDRLIEKIDHYNLWHKAIKMATANDSYAENEDNMLTGAWSYKTNASDLQVSDLSNAPQTGNYTIGLELLGLTKVQQLLPILNTYLRVVITLESARNCHVDDVSGNANNANTNDYTLNDVRMLYDTVEVMESYKEDLKRRIASDKGLTIPIQSYQVHTQDYRQNMLYPGSYAEVDSLYFLIKDFNASGKGQSYNYAPASNFSSVRVKASGKDITPSDGYRGFSEAFHGMRKSVNSQFNASGTTLFNRDRYENQMTLFGVDTEKLPAQSQVVGNGSDLRSMGMSIEFDFSADTGNYNQGVKFVLAVLHRKLLTFSNNSLTVAE